MQPSDLDIVYDFWFGGLQDHADPEPKVPLWFGAAPEVDALIRDRFEPWIDIAAAADWDVSALTLEQRIGLIVLLDQFPRNVYRGTARVYAHDARTLALAKAVTALGIDGVTLCQRMFIGLPLLHSENLADQDSALADFQANVEPFVDTTDGFWKGARRQNYLYNDIIRRFFPHRNPILGREMTPEEGQFLAETPMRPG